VAAAKFHGVVGGTLCPDSALASLIFMERAS
jgi:hypothetical protein